MSTREIKQIGAGRPTKLTPEVAKKLTEMWSLCDERVMSDHEIAVAAGINPSTLDRWIQGDSELRGLRTRARASVKISYLQSLNEILKLAIESEDFKTATAICFFMLERQYPAQFGRLLKVAASTSSRNWIETASEDELQAFIDENRSLIESKKTSDVPASE